MLNYWHVCLKCMKENHCQLCFLVKMTQYKSPATTCFSLKKRRRDFWACFKKIHLKLSHMLNSINYDYNPFICL